MMNKKMIKKTYQLQKDMAKMQEDLENVTVQSSVGGGVVRAIVTGKLKLQSLEIDPEAISRDDAEMLQDLIIAAVNDGLEQAQDMVSQQMSNLTGGINIPGIT